MSQYRPVGAHGGASSNHDIELHHVGHSNGSYTDSHAGLEHDGNHLLDGMGSPSHQSWTKRPGISATPLPDHPNSNLERRLSLAEKLDWKATAIFVVSAIVIVACIAFLVFLWSGQEAESTWHSIMANGWATRAVSFSALFTRTAVGLQAGIAAAMCAALALEMHGVKLSDAATLSIQRAVAPDPFALLYPIWSSARVTRYSVPLLVALLFTTTTLLQFSSTVLLSDLALGELPGLRQSSARPYDGWYSTGNASNLASLNDTFGWTIWQNLTFPLLPRMSTWTTPLTSFPTFAEYHEPPSQFTNGVDDTGTLLRAFVPYTDAQSRETVSNFSGTAMVLDSRVACQRPILSNISINGWPFADADNLTSWTLTGQVLHSEMPERFVPAGVDPVPFDCPIVAGNIGLVTAICQLETYDYSGFGNSGGSLLSQFMNFSVSDARTAHSEDPAEWSLPLWGPAYLVLQITGRYPLGANASSPFRVTNYTEFHTTFKQSFGFGASTPLVKLDATLCHAAWDTQNINITASSLHNRSEPVATTNFYVGGDGSPATSDTSNTANYAGTQFTQMIDQLNFNDSNLTTTQRGLMNLSLMSPSGSESWTPSPLANNTRPIQLSPLTQALGDFNGHGFLLQSNDQGSILTQALRGNWSLVLLNDRTTVLGWNAFTGSPTWRPTPSGNPGMSIPDVSFANLFMDAWNEYGSLASALSALITILTGLAYYDESFLYNAAANAEQVFLVATLYPQHWRGFAAFVVVVLAHELLVLTIVLVFLRRTRFTRLGSYWQAMAQLDSAQTEHVLASASLLSDGELKKGVLSGAQGRRRVRLGRVDDGKAVRVTSYEPAPLR